MMLTSVAARMGDLPGLVAFDRTVRASWRRERAIAIGKGDRGAL